ncbi:MAG: SDR family oxidoreductase [Acutalibacteraceae bacterium]|nr:SDR family oxidoreductase [Acutalibacteraceae bacterium]
MKTALVTGSSRGIGRAIAIRLAKDGYKVIVHGAGNVQKAEETKQIIEQNGGVAIVEMADLCNVEETKALAERIGKVDILVLNASLQYDTYLEDISADDMLSHYTCNAVSSLLLVQHFVPFMKEQKWGRIVTVGSVNEKKPIPKLMAYSMSKAAQTNMALSLASQLAEYGITVNNVAPGVIYTDRNVDALSNPEYAQKVTNSIPVGFYGEPRDCVGIVSLLCSDESRYITGQNIFVDGGKGL